MKWMYIIMLMEKLTMFAITQIIRIRIITLILTIIISLGKTDSLIGVVKSIIQIQVRFQCSKCTMFTERMIL